MNAFVSVPSVGTNSIENAIMRRSKTTEGTPQGQGAQYGLKSAATSKTKASTSTTSSDSSTTSSTASALDKDAFLQLLVMQMQYQDPMEPMDNSQMVAQLAQLTSLEQMNKLNTSFETLSGNIDQLNFISASNMVGRYVSGVDSSGTTHEGTVDGVQMDGSLVYLTIGDAKIPMAGVAQISAAQKK